MAQPRHPGFDPDDPGLLSVAQAGMLIDQYELTIASSYLGHGMGEPAVFELFVRHLPARRDWLLVAGLGPALALVRQLSFGDDDVAYLADRGFGEPFLRYLSAFRFTGDVDAMPEGTIAFANEPLVRVTAPLIEAQLLETLLLNQINFQTMIATKAARVVLAAGGGRPGAGERIIDFSPRRDHGIDAAMKAARSAAVAGAIGTSNVAAAMRYGLRPVGTMAHSYVLSFASEREAFETFLRDFPDNAVLLVDTYDTVEGVRNAIAASQATGVALSGVRLDSGDLDALSRAARELLDAAGLTSARILASGNLEESRIAELVAAGAPIDAWGVGTDLGTSRDSPTVDGVYKLVAHRRDGHWLGVRKRSPHKATVPGAKQVFRRYAGGAMRGDVIAMADESHPGRPLLVPVMRAGERVRSESLDDVRARADTELTALPGRLPYPVEWSARCLAAMAATAP